MELRRNTAGLFLGTHFSLMVGPFRGHLASRSSSHFRLQRPSTSLQHMLPKKPSGFDDSLEKYSPRFQLLQLSTATTKLPSLLQLTATIMPARNTSIYVTTLSISSLKTVPSNLSIALLTK